VVGEEASQASAERAGALDRKRAPPWRMSLRNPKCVDVAISIGGHVRLERHHTTSDLDHGHRVRVAMRIDTNDEVQLVCKHH
jgi:hypothetical protein